MSADDQVTYPDGTRAWLARAVSTETYEDLAVAHVRAVDEETAHFIGRQRLRQRECVPRNGWTCVIGEARPADLGMVPIDAPVEVT